MFLEEFHPVLQGNGWFEWTLRCQFSKTVFNFLPNSCEQFFLSNCLTLQASGSSWVSFFLSFRLLVLGAVYCSPILSFNLFLQLLLLFFTVLLSALCYWILPCFSCAVTILEVRHEMVEHCLSNIWHYALPVMFLTVRPHPKTLCNKQNILRSMFMKNVKKTICFLQANNVSQAV